MRGRTRTALFAVLALCAGALGGVGPAEGASPAVISAQQQKIVASDGAAADQFGSSVSVSGNTAVVGSPHDTNGGANSGSASVFTRSGTTWTEQDKLVAAVDSAPDEFGSSVSVSGNTAVVGSPRNTDDGSDSGSAHVFTRSGTTWTEQKLVASDAATFDEFGSAVSISGNTAVVGSPFDADGGSESGSAYVFTRSGDTWTEQDKLVAADADVGDRFGLAVAVSGNTAVVGSRLDDTDGGTDSGSAYVFTRSGTTWTEQDKLVAADLAAGDIFGRSVAVSANTAVVGSPFDDDDGTDSGSAYVFTRSGTTWTEQDKLVAADPATGDHFGFSVAVSGNTAVVGSQDDDDGGSNSGSAYVFTRSGDTWTEQDKLVAVDPDIGDLFGSSVALSGTTALVGSRLDDDDGTSSGSAYVFGPRPLVSIGDAAAPEGDAGTSPLTFAVSLSGPVDHNVKVKVSTKNGTAKEPSDYKEASATVRFAPGEVTRTFDVKVKGDTKVEDDETFVVRLSKPKKAIIGNAKGLGLIINDD